MSEQAISIVAVPPYLVDPHSQHFGEQPPVIIFVFTQSMQQKSEKSEGVRIPRHAHTVVPGTGTRVKGFPAQYVHSEYKIGRLTGRVGSLIRGLDENNAQNNVWDDGTINYRTPHRTCL